MNGTCGLNEISAQCVWRFYFGHCVLLIILSGIGMTECPHVEFWDHIYYLNIFLMLLTFSLGAKAYKTAISDQKYVETLYINMLNSVKQFGGNTHLPEFLTSVKDFLKSLHVETHKFTNFGDKMDDYFNKVNAKLDDNGEVMQNVVMEIQAQNPA